MKTKYYWKNKMPLPEGGKSLGMLSMLYSQLSEEHNNNIKFSNKKQFSSKITCS